MTAPYVPTLHSKINVFPRPDTPSRCRSRRSARRWSGREPAADAEPEKSGQTLAKTDPHPVETLVASLLEPRDMDQRVEEYDWYVYFLTANFEGLY